VNILLGLLPPILDVRRIGASPLELARGCGDWLAVTVGLMHFALVAHFEGDHAMANSQVDEGVARARDERVDVQLAVGLVIRRRMLI